MSEAGIRRPSVGIVTLNWNGIDDTRECLDSLAHLSYDNYRVLVVDNASKDDQATILAKEYPWCEVLPQDTNLGFTGGCNVGISAALGQGCEYVLLLNNDTTVEPDFLDKLVDFYTATSDAGAVGPLMTYYDSDRVWFAGGRISIGTGFAVACGKGRGSQEYRRLAPYTTEYVAGCCLLVSAEVIAEVGEFDPAYFAYYEDSDWCYRMTMAGKQNYVVPDSVIYHKKSASTGPAGTNRLSRVAAYYVARNAFYFARRNLRGWRRFMFVTAQFCVRAPYNLLLRAGPGARRRYLRGIYDGIRMGSRPQ